MIKIGELLPHDQRGSSLHPVIRKLAPTQRQPMDVGRGGAQVRAWWLRLALKSGRFVCSVPDLRGAQNEIKRPVGRQQEDQEDHWEDVQRAASDEGEKLASRTVTLA